MSPVFPFQSSSHACAGAHLLQVRVEKLAAVAQFGRLDDHEAAFAHAEKHRRASDELRILRFKLDRVVHEAGCDMTRGPALVHGSTSVKSGIADMHALVWAAEHTPRSRVAATAAPMRM